MGKEIAGKLVEAVRTHVGDVDIAHTASGLLGHMLDVVLHPLVVSELILVLDGFHHYLVCSLATGGHGELGEHARLASQHRVDVEHCVGGHAVDSGDVIAHLHVEAGLGQRAAQLCAVGGSLVDLGDFVGFAFTCQCGTEHAYVLPVYLHMVAAVDIGMAAGQLAYHAAYHIGEVDAVFHPRQQCGILVVYHVPVHTMHVLQVEAVAVVAPSLVVDVFPLLRVVDCGRQVVEVHGIGKVDFALWQLGDIYIVAFEEAGLLGIGCDIHQGSGGYELVFLLLEIVEMGAAVAVVPQQLSVAVEVAIVVAAHWHLHDALCQTVAIDSDS